MALSREEAFARFDEEPDEAFYGAPRFVTHIDEWAVARVTNLYREHFPAGASVLDLMSSWVSHLPENVRYGRVVGLGLNEAELAANPRLSTYVVQNLNENPQLPFRDDEFDAAGCCVSIQYLTRPVEVLRDVGRCLKEGAPLVITFSNRCFPTKAVRVWQKLDDEGHEALIKEYLRRAGNWTAFETLGRNSRRPGGDPLYAVVGRKTTSCM